MLIVIFEGFPPLSFDDILHYQNIIVALTETDRIMQEIDAVGVEG